VFTLGFSGVRVTRYLVFMCNVKGQKDKHLSTKHYINNQRLSNTNPTGVNSGALEVLAFPALLYLCYKPLFVCIMENQRMSISDMLFTDSYVTRVTIRVSLVEQEMLTLPEHLSSYFNFITLAGTTMRSFAMVI
jgi:hypothetical protein